MEKYGLLVRLIASPGKEPELNKFLQNAQSLVEAETGTNTWFAFHISGPAFGIFDTFSEDADRNTHLAGEVAASLMENAPELLLQAPTIEKIDILASKISSQ